jgi:hypothetical protein
LKIARLSKWYVGSTQSGQGLVVQEAALNYYQNEGGITGILSPVR